MKDLSIYRPYNKASVYREFKDKYNYPNMHINSYRRVLYGESTYLRKGHSPYIADIIRFLSDKLQKHFIDVAYDLLDSEYFGKKNTLFDVLVCETKCSDSVLQIILGDTAEALKDIRLCDLNLDNKSIYYNALEKVNKYKISKE